MGIAALVIALVLHLHVPARARPTVVQPVWPAQGTITTPFGREPGGGWHPGVDIGVLRSLVVRAAIPGRVVAVGEPVGYEGYGNVVVERSRGYTELYAHLAAWRVRVGQRVWAGEHIATAGCTGWCTGTHLHFEVRRDGVAVSPFATVLAPLLARRPARRLTSARTSARPPWGAFLRAFL